MTHYNSFAVESDDGSMPILYDTDLEVFTNIHVSDLLWGLSDTKENVQVFIENIC